MLQCSIKIDPCPPVSNKSREGKPDDTHSYQYPRFFDTCSAPQHLGQDGHPVFDRGISDLKISC